MTQAAERKPFVGAAIGLRVGPVEVDVEGGYLRDILPEGVASALNDLQRQRALPVQVIASVPAVYGLGSLRLIPGVGPLRPFVSAGAGLARISPRLDVEVNGISLGDVFGLTSFEATTAPMAAIGAGLRLDGGAIHVEGGYRFLVIKSDFRPVNLGEVATRVNSVYVALGGRF
jgi:hypothetical protein